MSDMDQYVNFNILNLYVVCILTLPYLILAHLDGPVGFGFAIPPPGRTMVIVEAHEANHSRFKEGSLWISSQRQR
jgi:hypothetical protein